MLNIEIAAIPFTAEVQGVSVPGRVRRLSGSERAELVATNTRAGDDVVMGMDATIRAAADVLVEVAVSLTRDGEPWPMPPRGPEREEWVGYLPDELLSAIVQAAAGGARPQGDEKNS